MHEEARERWAGPGSSGSADGAFASFLPEFHRALLAESAAGGGAPTHKCVSAAALLVDVSGFTALTDHLSHHGAFGAERVSQLIEAHFRPITEIVTGLGGDVVHFAGDSLFAVWPVVTTRELPSAARRAARAALDIQAALVARGNLRHETALKVRASVGAGSLDVIGVGGVGGAWLGLLAGDALRQVSRCDQFAPPGAVVLSAEAHTALGAHASCVPAGAGASLLTALTASLHDDEHATSTYPYVAPALLEPLIPRTVKDRLRAGLGEWLTEFRSISVAFVRLPDLELYAPGSLDRLQAYVSEVQSAVERYGGMIYQFVTEEQGTTLIIAFGALATAHPDAPARAVGVAMDVRDLAVQHQFPARVAVTTGLAYCGVYGTEQRRQYGLVGPLMNRAARLVQTAEAGEVLADEVTRARAERPRTAFVDLGPRHLAGIDGNVAAFRAVRHPAPPSAELGSAPRLVGRDPELAVLTAGLAELVRARTGSTIVIEGQPGIGKSRLLAELAGRARAEGVRVLAGSAEEIARGRAYHAWQPVFTELLGVGHALMTRQKVEDGVRRSLAAVRARADWAPLLNAILPTTLPESAVTAEMPNMARAENTRALLLELIERQADAEPTLVLLEDAQWLDSASQAFLHHVATRARRVLLIVSSHLPSGTPGAAAVLHDVPAVRRVCLQPLAESHTRALVAGCLGAPEIPQELVELVYRRTHGNPLFAVEVARALRDHGLLVTSGTRCTLASPGRDLERAVEESFSGRGLPATLEGIVNSRLDRLPAMEQITLKVASVFGRAFPAAALQAIHPERVGADALGRAVDALVRLEILQRDESAAHPTLAFRHAMIRDVAYSSLSFARRRELHLSVATWYEQASGEENSSAHTSMLAHHWSRAQVVPKAFHYLAEAGDQALREFAGREAVGYLMDATSLADDPALARAMPSPELRTRRARVEMALGRAYLSLSMYERDRPHLERGLALLDLPVPKHRAAVAAGVVKEIAVQVMHRLRPASSPAARGGNADRVRRLEAAAALEGLAETYYYTGEEVRTFYACLRTLNLAESAGWSAELARGYATLGAVVGYVPLHGLSEFYGRRSVAVAREINRPDAITWVCVMTGIARAGRGEWAGARALFEEARDVAARIGDRRRWADAAGHLGTLDWLLGDNARALEVADDLVARAEQQDDARYRVEALRSRAHVLVDTGDLDAALDAVGEIERSLSAAPAAIGMITRSDCLSMRATIHARRGEHGLALESATAGSALLRRAVVADDLYLGYITAAGVAEAAVTLVEHGERRAAPHAQHACAVLARLARVFPVAVPRAQLYRGRLAWLAEKPTKAHAAWRRSMSAAGALTMPFDLALAEAEMGRHLPAADPERRRLLVRAHERFQRVGASYHAASVRPDVR